MHGHTARDLAVTNIMKKALDTPVVSSTDTQSNQVGFTIKLKPPDLVGSVSAIQPFSHL